MVMAATFRKTESIGRYIYVEFDGHLYRQVGVLRGKGVMIIVQVVSERGVNTYKYIVYNA